MSKTTLISGKPLAPIFIFDIETVPDIPLFFKKYDSSAVASHTDEEIWNDLAAYKKLSQQVGIEFPQTLYHSVVCICGVFVDPNTFTIMDGIKLTTPVANSYAEFLENEKNLLQKFWQFTLKHENFHKTWYDQTLNDKYMSDYQRNKLKKQPLTFCGYNISNFDLAVIEQRSLLNFITCPIDDYAKNLGTDSYRYKYAADKVFDLINFVSNYDNRNAKVGIDILAQGLGLAGKMDQMHGSLVAEFFYLRKDTKSIEDYCSVDVLITYGVFLAVQKYRGIISEDELSDCSYWFHNWLMKEGKPQVYQDLALGSSSFFKKTQKTK